MRPFVIVRDLFLILLVGLLIAVFSGWLSWIWIAVLVFLFISTLAIGATRIGLNFFIPAYHHGDRSSKLIALSFDDGPAAFTEQILDILKQEQVQAAFFSIGKRAQADPAIVRRWSEEGHLIGNHSFSHSVHFDWQGRTKMLSEINKTNETIKAITGVTPLLFRPPFGVTTPELSHAVTLAGMQTIGWSLRSFDTTSKDATKLLHKLMLEVKGGDIILLHDSMANTAGILTAFIRGCRENGFTFVRLDKMLGLAAYA